MTLRYLPVLLTILLGAISVRGQENWLLAFPEIAFDDARLCFSNERWTGFFHLESKLMYTVPRDSVDLPPLSRAHLAIIGGDYLFAGSGPEITRLRPPLLPDIYALPVLNERVLNTVTEKWPGKPAADEVTEEIGPLIFRSPEVWFGLVARSGDGDLTGGLGWFDSREEQFGRVYSGELTGYQPVWLGGMGDTVYALLENPETAYRKLVALFTATGDLSLLDWRGYGIPGDTLVNVAQWRNALAIATNDAVAIWSPGHAAAVWTTKAFAATEFVRMRMLQFVDGVPDENAIQDFLPLRRSRPSEAMARVGDWIEVVAHEGVEALVSKSDWDRYSGRWSAEDWGCRDLCFARVRVPTRDTYMDGDIVNTPITFLEYLGDSVKVGFAAGWVRIDEMAPALLPYP